MVFPRSLNDQHHPQNSSTQKGKLICHGMNGTKTQKIPKEVGLVQVGLVQVGLAMLKGCESQLRKRQLQIVSAVALVESITLSDTLQKTDTSYPWKNDVIFSTTLGKDVGQLPVISLAHQTRTRMRATI